MRLFYLNISGLIKGSESVQDIKGVIIVCYFTSCYYFQMSVLNLLSF